MAPRLPLASAATVLAGLVLAPVLATAQLNGATGLGASYQHYRFSNPEAAQTSSIGLLTVPFAARAMVGRGVRVDMAGAYAYGVLTRDDGSTATISGLVDTQLRVGVPVAGELLTVTGLVVLPTGISTATREQAEVAGAIASDLLPFRISNWGSGGGAGLSASVAHSFGQYAAGGGLTYLVSREFAPLEGTELAAYRPGDQLSAQLVVTRNVRRSEKASLQLVYQHQSSDQSEGRNLFRSGDRFQAVGSYAFRIRRTSTGIVYGGGQYREKGAALLELTRDAPSQTLLFVGGGLRLPRGAGVLSPSADLRLLRSQDGVGQGYLSGLGFASEWPIGRFRAGPQLRFQVGRVLVREGSQTGFAGGELGLTVQL